MTRIPFVTDQDRIQGNYLLAKTGVVRRLRGQIFETTERGVKLLHEHQISRAVLDRGDVRAMHYTASERSTVRSSRGRRLCPAAARLAGWGVGHVHDARGCRSFDAG